MTQVPFLDNGKEYRSHLNSESYNHFIMLQTCSTTLMLHALQICDGAKEPNVIPIPLVACAVEVSAHETYGIIIAPTG